MGPSLIRVCGARFFHPASTRGPVRRKRRWIPLPLLLTGLLLGLLPLPSVHAESTLQGFELRQFIPAPGLSTSYLSVRGADLAASPRLELTLSLDSAHDPLVAYNADGTKIGALVANQTITSLLGNLSLTPWLDLSFDLPMVVFQRGDALIVAEDTLLEQAGFGAGDVRITPRVALWRGVSPNAEHATWLAFQLGLVLPSGNQDWFQGDAGPQLVPALLLEHALKNGIRVAGNLGMTLRQSASFLNIAVANTLDFSAAGLIPLGGYWAVVPELSGHASLVGTGFGWEELPLELRAGVRYRLVPGRDRGEVLLQAGMGLGAVPGYGSPSVRGIFGMSYRPPEPCHKDLDQDGVLDIVDACPEMPEDLDQFEDWDGCPDGDNDQDGLLDAVDICQNEAEDKDSFEDEDGCPELDNDNDTVPDPKDKCPNKQEDVDGFEDNDGCPDLDNDADGIADGLDRCPHETEDPDEIQDLDGCPEKDADADGIPDPRDRCPLVPEVIDGVEDSDGCPDQASKPTPGERLTVTCKKIELKEQVFFETGSAEILPRSFPLLGELVRTIRANPWILKLQVEGHTDSRGSDTLNLSLSQRRAEAVKVYLISHGISPLQLTSVGFGETKPIASNTTEQGRARNRRVELIILETDAHCQP